MELSSISEIKKLIAKDKIESAITLMNKLCKGTPFNEDVILIQAQFKSLLKRQIRRTIGDEFSNISENRIRESVLKMLNVIQISSEKNEQIDSYRYLHYSNRQQSRYDYYNYQRVFELFLVHQIEYKDIEVYDKLRNLNIINELGTLNENESWKTQQKPTIFKTDVEIGFLIVFYVRRIIEKLIPKLYLKDITNIITSKSKIKAKLNQGDFFYGQLGFYFKDIETYSEGKRQLRKAYYKSKKVHIEFIYDAWECTSNSGRFSSTRNRKIVNPILYLKSIEEINNVLNLHVSCLAIGYAFDNIKINRNMYS